ncbi:hypothetical protein [Kaistia dalseonensis]|nr:hypothetical protein [Kaistia dalseonensis]
MALATFGVATGASAGEAADKAAEAEKLLAAGKVDEAVAAFDESIEAFWKTAPLGFRKAVFVDKVNGFGDYVAHEGTTFAPKSELKIYAEPVGFGSTVTATGHRIAFKTEIEIRNQSGQILARSPNPAPLEKTGLSRSREFQITVGFQLPDLKPGVYVLVLKVTDEATGKSAPIELPLTIS